MRGMKGIIVAAGYGTRFLPVTRTVPKEMLPLIDRPSLDFILEEFAAADVRDVLIISSRRKKVLEDYLDREVELESVFLREGATEKLAKVTPPDLSVAFLRQREMRGTGHALLQARPFIGDEPVIVAYPDDLHFGDVPLAAQLVETWRDTGACVMATIHDPPHLERYGVLDLADDGLHVRSMVEKPAPGKAPSREVSIGRYLYTPAFFDHLAEGWEKHEEGEYYHLYALEKMMAAGKVVHCRVVGERLDTGEPAGYLRALLR